MILYYSSEFISNSKYLKKQSMRAYDRGWYECVATNKLGSERNAFPVDVYSECCYFSFIHSVSKLFLGLPRITYITTNTTTSYFDELNLECLAKGIPLPFISWELNNEAILEPSNDIYQHYQSGQIGPYRIPMIHGGAGVLTVEHNNEISLKITYSKYMKKNPGKYSCLAISHYGRDEKFVNIRVACKYFRMNLSKIYFQSMTLFCSKES